MCDDKKPKEGSEPRGLIDQKLFLMALKRMGYLPGTFVLFGFVVAAFKQMLIEKSQLGNWVELAAGILVAVGILWWLARLFSKLFEKRPARGMADGLLAGIVAGLIGGYFGFGWIDWWQVQGTSIAIIHPGEIDSRPSWVRVLIAFIYTVPIAGILGLGCDLVHTDRKINWRKSFTTVFLVGSAFLIVILFGVVQFLPHQNTRGMTLSDRMLLFEVFILVYPTLVTVSFGWKWRKILSRYIWIVGAIFITRIITYFWQTNDSESLGWAKALHRVSADAISVSIWERPGCYETHGQDEFNLAIEIAALCMWVIVVYWCFYSDHPPALALDRWIVGKKQKRGGRSPRKSTKQPPAI